MNLDYKFEFATLVKVAQHFETAGMAEDAAQAWTRLHSNFPYDRAVSEKLGSLLYDQSQSGYALGTVARSRFLLTTIFWSFPSQKLTGAYFENLDLLLAGRTKRDWPGDVVLGCGTGRCGSTTLSVAVSNVPESCATHQNPPLIHWEPLEEQVHFHFERLRRLADYYALVFDASHWWLNALGRFYAEFPDGKVVGLHRNIPSCVRSFLSTKGKGRQTINHWAPRGNTLWRADSSDPTYPSYPMPADPIVNPDSAKAVMIERYVREYNETLASLAHGFAGRLLLVRTEDMSDPATVEQLSRFLGKPVTMPSRALNAGGTSDSERRPNML
jgi:hypothetical protein